MLRNPKQRCLIKADITSTIRILYTAALLLVLLNTSCNTVGKDNKNVSAAPLADLEQTIQPVDASSLELTPYDYINWLKSNKGLTYTVFENDSLLLSIMYQPYQLQAALGMQGSGISYEQLLDSKKGFHYFMIDCLYKKVSVVNKNKRGDFLNFIKNNTCVITNVNDTLKNSPVEVFTSPIMNKPDNIMILIPDERVAGDLICMINTNALGLKDVKIKIPEKQFDLFPKLKL